jgi:beta-phosphoglucomutase-like phosphatase (HAD superfamily)
MSAEKTADTEKPLEKMTVKALREIGKEIPEITGVHGMKKEELIVAIKEAKGIKDEPVKDTQEEPDKKVKATKDVSAKKPGITVGDLKKKIHATKAQRRDAIEAKDKKMATIYKRRLSRLKKKSRKAAA